MRYNLIPRPSVWYNLIPRPSVRYNLIPRPSLAQLFFFLQTASDQKPELAGEDLGTKVVVQNFKSSCTSIRTAEIIELGRQGEREDVFGLRQHWSLPEQFAAPLGPLNPGRQKHWSTEVAPLELLVLGGHWLHMVELGNP